MIANKIPFTNAACSQLVAKIDKCRKESADLKAKRGRLQRPPNTHTTTNTESIVLGRLGVTLINGAKRSIVLRAGDIPAVVVKNFVSRHANLVSEEEARRCVLFLNDVVRKNKRKIYES